MTDVCSRVWLAPRGVLFSRLCARWSHTNPTSFVSAAGEGARGRGKERLGMEGMGFGGGMLFKELGSLERVPRHLQYTQ